MTTDLQNVIGHELQFEMFRRATSRQRLGHAYLFTGAVGIGKRTFAVHLAQALLCQNRPGDELTACGECPSCRQVISHSHPDLFRVGLPEGKSELPIEVFVGSPEKRGREGLCHDLSLSPMQGGYRIAVIDDADKMNASSANALLKTLEEPGPGAILILIAIDSDQVITTIRSRCQQVNFTRLSDQDLHQILTRINMVEHEGELDSKLLEEAIRRADGSVSKARIAMERLQAGESHELHKVTQLLGRRKIMSADLAMVFDEVTSQAGSDTNSQREAALLIIETCLQYFHQSLTMETGISQLDQVHSDCYLDAMDRCFEASRQIDRKISVPACLDQFCHDLEMLLRPTWNSAGQ
ncbi:DNA polymerase III subunit delta' [Rubinisphaera italica]|uniref:DNA polymerase III subunit tau n=1 Tax=Rubinisphaera italica TaxID=2527969 RepID=A0A5C5XLW5_9PLAN|nr:DNA polymerase III subunit delta' [Rubinisphaera italica]TWT63874.1 DNA polymerase III subunit tau [Rubinisphaera italica]